MPEAQTIESAVAARVRQVRKDHSLTRDAVATTARKYGMTWSTGSVGNLEAGKMSMTLSAMLVLAQVLHDLTGDAFTLADLLDDIPLARLTPTVSVPAGRVRTALRGGTVSLGLPPGHMPQRGDRDYSLTATVAHALTPQKIQLLDGIWRDSGLAEERAAAALGISVKELGAQCADLWGTTLSVERDSRTGPGASAQKRGHVTRQLLDEIRDRRQALRNG